LEELAQDNQEWNIRERVAENKNTPDYILDKICDDCLRYKESYVELYRKIVRHRNTSPKTLEKLINYAGSGFNSTNKEIRETALGRLTGTIKIID
ncbi:MAG: hypothetical protein LBT99_03610, partial [Bifidobacteriaceae bacterium]|jgi:hypothetical protein|nr:hypothetical protein [Bifidobacteriaceae bacterium]